MKQQRCLICSKTIEEELLFNDETKEWYFNEEHVHIFVHDPNNTHVDVEREVHKECHEKIKKVHPNYGQPVEADRLNPVFPVIGKDQVIKTLPLKEAFETLANALAQGKEVI